MKVWAANKDLVFMLKSLQAGAVKGSKSYAFMRQLQNKVQEANGQIEEIKKAEHALVIPEEILEQLRAKIDAGASAEELMNWAPVVDKILQHEEPNADGPGGDARTAGV